MEQARELAQQFMSGRGEGEHVAPASAEAAVGDKQPAVAGTEAGTGGGGMMAGLMHTAQGFLGDQQQEGGGGSGSHPSAGGGIQGLAQQFMGGGGAAQGGGSGSGGGTSAAGLMGAAQAFLGGGGGSSGGGAVSGVTHEGGGQMNAGLVDKLLAAFQAHEGKQFEGKEGEYDQLAGMAQRMLGTPIGRDLLKMWVKQRMGW